MMRKFALGTLSVLAVGVAATNCRVAYAGEWEYAGVFYEGSVIRDEGAFGKATPHDSTHSSENWNEHATGEWTVRGSAGKSHTQGRARWKYHWKRSNVYQPNPNGGSSGQWVPDPNDNPPASLWLIVTLSAEATAFSGDDYYWSRDVSKESAYANIDIESVPPYSLHVPGADNGQRMEAKAQLAKFVRVPTNGQENVFGPWGAVDAKGALQGDRYWVYNPAYPEYAYGITGEVNSRASYGAPFANFRLIEPDPAGNPLLGQNEYTMMGGGAPFVVPARTSIASLGINAAVLDAIKAGSYWELSRTLSNALAGIENGYVYNNGTTPLSGAVFPRFRSDATNDLDPSDPSKGAIKEGLGFSTKNGLPTNNSDFGARNVDYYFNNIYYQFAPIEVFYAATAQTHPVGNTKFCAKNSNGAMAHLQNDYLISSDPFQAATPNWFNYYSQAWSSPVPIAYDHAGFVEVIKDSQGNITQSIDTGRSSYTPGDNHLHISRDAHGEYDVDLYERRNFYLGVRHVGYQ